PRGHGAQAPSPPRGGVRRPAGPRPATAPPRSSSPAVPIPIGPTARRFLRPLVGIDPGEVTIHRGPQADRTAAAWSAAGLARGEEIVLGPTGPETAPETLGLLAHELTHVARHRSPRFVPPILRQPSTGFVDTTNEEDVAGKVEQSVRALARRAETPSSPSPPAPPEDLASGPTTVETGPTA